MSGGVWLTPFKFDACTFIALTDDGLQRLTQSRCETSSSSTVDDFEDRGLLKWALVVPTKHLRYDERRRVQMRV